MVLYMIAEDGICDKSDRRPQVLNDNGGGRVMMA